MKSAQLLRAAVSPQIVVRQIVRRLGIGSIEFRLAMQALRRAEYAFGIKQAIYLASRLKHGRVSVVEFGVGTGVGLKLMEQYARDLEHKYGIVVDVYGFDLGSGLPSPKDYRDLPYIWRAGEYRMDTKKLQGELRRAKLLLGNVGETIQQFLEGKPAPVGFISFDLDYYSSTAAAFRVFDSADESLLPRVVCYFDDIISDGKSLHCEYVGELLAIREFNERSERCDKLCRMNVREPIVKYPAPWLDQLWVYHRFSHPQYNSYLGD